jgi:hypothetical protein
MSRTADREIFLRELKELGGAAGNYKLMETLRWDEDRYWRVHAAVVEEGDVEKGRGRGGSVALVRRRRSSASRPEESEQAAEDTGRESDLYQPIEQVLRDKWAREESFDRCVVQVTAHQGRRKTGGTWTRPDITVVSTKRFLYVPHSDFDVWTFEIKPEGEIDITGVYEAKAHSRRATRSYVMFHAPRRDSQMQEVIKACVAEAERIDVGLIVFEKVDDFATWEILVRAPRVDVDHELLEEFIKQLPERVRNEIAKWR